MGLPHVLALPFPAQGHVIPFMELCHCLVDHGFKVTFVNTEFNHKRLLTALSAESTVEQIALVTVPDGLGPEEDRNDLARLAEAFMKVMPRCLEELIEKSNETEDPMTCMLVDANMGWALEVGCKKGLRPASFWPAAAQVLATLLSIPELISRGVIDADGTQISEHETFQLGSSTSRSSSSATPSKRSKSQPSATIQRFFPSGRCSPASGRAAPACLSWLDEQQPGSVVYVAFGSFTIFDRLQFQEFALGLEATGRPFLWVVRPDLISDSADAYPDGFKERVGERGRVVAWAPQQKVLAHPSVACFVSHCGWNSTMEGVRNGKLFLCWPYFGDQFLNQSYICDDWKVGLRMTPDESGIVKREQVKSKVEELLSNEEMRARASMLKENAQQNINEGGASLENLKTFMDAFKP
ncbi:hypothetical protein ZIOFF_027710 [Zingiber officinale]|uniref:UDP-glycosyltransferase 83A1 n=1 Tax=Zingiber officinale TaxID=94328 RepID=A0A8J5GLU7_ZINOF|nr:hypothetical protein ZIOFF_027710 [Zingiber officinale]